MIHLLTDNVTPAQLVEMLEALTDYVKLAVDIEQGIAAGGGELHADCEAMLLENDCEQENIWGADWVPATREVRYQSFINIRPRQGNPAMELLDPALRARVRTLVSELFAHTVVAPHAANEAFAARQERYTRDALPVRLGNLASNLARLHSFAQHEEMSEAAARVVRESQLFIEWTTADAELNELAQTLTNWETHWPSIWRDNAQRDTLAATAQTWSTRILEHSGLLAPESD
jgi:Protein of unknown function (DUF5674)